MENVGVDTTFLYGEVKEVIYMDEPDGFADKQHHDKKCLLNKCLYGKATMEIRDRGADRIPVMSEPVNGWIPGPTSGQIASIGHSD